MIKDIQYDSSALKESISMRVIFPTAAEIDRVLVWLHGKLQREKDFEHIKKDTEELELEALAEKYKVAIIMPCMRNCYYISTEDYNISLFLKEELPDVMEKSFFVNPDVELIIGGISMGGYGAVLCAAATGMFHKIISISGAFIQDDVRIGNHEVWCGRIPTVESTRGSYLEYFLPLEDLEQSVRRNVIPALSLFHSRQQKPFVIMTCGTADWLYLRNKRFAEELKKQNIDFIFEELPAGDHNAICFKQGLWKVMEMINSA